MRQLVPDLCCSVTSRSRYASTGNRCSAHTAVQMTPVSGAETPKVTSELKLAIQPARAAVFVDNKYVGHAGESGGAVHSLQLPTGQHHIKVELAGYLTFDTNVTLIAGQKSEVKTERRLY